MKIRALIVLACGLLLAADNAKEATAKAWKELAGEWQPVSMEIDGNKLPDDDVKTFKITLGEGIYKAERGSETVDEGKMTIDLAKKPHCLSLISTSGADKDKERLGIWEKDGDTMKFCVAPVDKERPKEFASTSGSGSILITFNRKK